ncbi:uncharacterized protein LOC125858892 [Solanum stenotomum]|uniref:uncharacterized protein LOC125858892 n=1 Tax=Solanum stenotomum TaxID=172797 RepID=UPI0020D0AD97|nr:uncharacterized protein LOC125858892 [Solanum stenotomum]
MKGVMRFGKKWKRSPRYIGPYRISNRIGNVAYELELPPELPAVHPVFHISMLKKCLSDPSLIVPTENIDIKDNLSYKEIPIQILNRHIMPPPRTNTCNANTIPLVPNHEVMNAEFQNVIQLLAKTVDNQTNLQAPVPTNPTGGSAAARV